MFKATTPESVGISSKKVLEIYKFLQRSGLATHSVIMARGDKIFSESYWAPFNKDFRHRMYSVTKSFVAVAVGFAVQDGYFGLDDSVAELFKRYFDIEPDPLLAEATVRDMLMMSSSHIGAFNVFKPGDYDRFEKYFTVPGQKIPGTVFHYDSHGTGVLSALVERCTGMQFIDYLKEKVLKYTGFNTDVECVQMQGGSFGGSGVLCTARDLLIFARFVMNLGTWDGKRYLNEDFLREATTKQISNSLEGFKTPLSSGYGYKIWILPENGFAFVGLGMQLAICHPGTDFIFIINSDNQGKTYNYKEPLIDRIYETLIHNFSDALPEDKDAYAELCDYTRDLELYALSGDTYSETCDRINGVTYTLNENPMGIEYVRLDFEGKKGKLTYKNAQGEKKLTFGMGYNEFVKFPQSGYSDMDASHPCPGNLYDCAASAVWEDKNKLLICAQIIDKYFGRACMNFSFKDSRIQVTMLSHAENFLGEYSGTAMGEAKKQV